MVLAGVDLHSNSDKLDLIQHSDFVLDNLLLEHVGLPHVLVLTVHLVNFLGWMGKGIILPKNAKD